jgi:hypothetical protein
MDKWTEIKNAYIKSPALGGAKARLLTFLRIGATVIRHIDMLEAKLRQGARLRNKTGYTPTEAGRRTFCVWRCGQRSSLTNWLDDERAAVPPKLLV